MNRSLTIERVYNLGDFKSIRLGETIENIPEELLLNTELIQKLRFLQFIETERSYRKYLQVNARYNNMSVEDALAELDELKINTVTTIKQIIEGE